MGAGSPPVFSDRIILCLLPFHFGAFRTPFPQLRPPIPVSALLDGNDLNSVFPMSSSPSAASGSPVGKLKSFQKFQSRKFASPQL